MTTDNQQHRPRIILITGERQAGKTTLCLKLYRLLKRQGIAVSGMITRQPRPHTLISIELRNGHRHTLTYPFDSDQGIALTHFRINPETMARSAEGVHRSFPTQVFILDELGPLELVRGEGWIEALSLLKTGEYNVALIVVRLTLLSAAVRQLTADWYTLIRLTAHNRDAISERLFQEILSVLASRPLDQARN